ncbi:MAG: hypothetical protein WD851_09320 [Pirellulales bacterium]
MPSAAPQLVLMPPEAFVSLGISSVPKLLLTTLETCDALGISQRQLFDCTAPRGPFRAVKLGDRTLRYAVETLREDIARLQQEQSASVAAEK